LRFRLDITFYSARNIAKYAALQGPKSPSAGSRGAAARCFIMVRYLGIEVDDAIEIAEKVDI
jgi:hypothetical protein